MSSTSEASPGSDSNHDDRPKFTRGEKCIFIHLVVTFSIILFLILIYFIHLCVVTHSLRDVWKITRRATKKNQYDPEASQYPVGHVYLKDMPLRMLCNAVLLRPLWSAAPAHCLAARTDPDTASLLFSWRIRYKHQDRFVESKVKRSIPHPHFDREDFRNNVGLLEHVDLIEIQYFVFPTSATGINDDLLLHHANNLALFGWSINSTVHEEKVPELIRYEVEPVVTAKCVEFMKPILDLRSYEHCVLLKQKLDDDDSLPDHGSVLVVGSTIIGFFGWGEKSGQGAPCIVLDFQFFKTWLENIIAWQRINVQENA